MVQFVCTVCDSKYFDILNEDLNITLAEYDICQKQEFWSLGIAQKMKHNKDAR
jgi:hypothetical protein